MFLSESQIRQLHLLKKKAPGERFFIMARLIAGEIEAMKAGIKYSKAGINEKELDKCLKVRMRQIYSWKH
jgi:hypothetical protein